MLELISSYSFNLYYVKGKDMIRSDFLSQQKNDNSDPSEIIPISFNAYNILEENRKVNVHINFPCKDENKFLIQTHSQTKMSSTKLPEVHRVRKELNPNLRPEKQHAMPKKGMIEKPHIGQGRAGSRRKHVPDRINQPFDVTRIPERSKTVTGITNNLQHTSATHERGINNDKSLSPDVLLHLPHRFLPRQQNVEKVIPNNDNSGSNLDIEENSPFQEGIIFETIQRLDKMFFQKPKSLDDILDTANLIHKFLPKQMDIEKILYIIQRKVLKGTHLPIEVKEIQTGYLHSPYFKDIYQYLSQNKLPHSKMAIKKLEPLSERYILLDPLLFRIFPDKETAVLAIPEACPDKIITL